MVNGFHKRLGTPGKHIRFAASVLSSDKESADKSFDTQEFIAKTFEVYEKSHKTEKNKIANQSAKFSDRGLISAPQRAKQQQTAEKPFDAKEFIEKTLAAYEQSRMISQTMELAGVPSWAKSTNSTTKKTAEPPKSSMKAATALFPSSGRTRKKWDSETSGKPNFRPAAAAERDLETSKTLTWTYKASLYASNHLCRLVKPRSTVGETPREKAKRLVALAKSGRKSYKNINNVAHLSPTGKGSLER